jgi:group I intron endonuclease
MTIGVYKITNTANGCFYIGHSIDIETRMYQHRRELTKNIHSNKPLQDDWNKHGECCFEFSVMAFTKTTYEAQAEEHRLVESAYDNMNTCYNKIKASPDTARKGLVAWLGNVRIPKFRQKLEDAAIRDGFPNWSSAMEAYATGQYTLTLKGKQS